MAIEASNTTEQKRINNERYILGAILTRPELMADAYDDLVRWKFSDARLDFIAAIFRHLWDERRPITPLEVAMYGKRMMLIHLTIDELTDLVYGVPTDPEWKPLMEHLENIAAGWDEVIDIEV